MADGKTVDESLKNADVIIGEWIECANEIGMDIPQDDFEQIESTNPSSIDVASYVLERLNAIDTWMLQKLVYYCQAWCLGIYKCVFINDSFKDYANGPVNKRLFDTHKSKRVVTKNSYPMQHKFSESEIRHMDNVIDTYRYEDGDTLREYTHFERPWKETRGNLREGERDDKDIPEHLMMEYYRN